MTRSKPKPQTFTEAEYTAIVDAFSFAFRACESNTSSLFDLRGARALRQSYTTILDKLGVATYGVQED